MGKLILTHELNPDLIEIHLNLIKYTKCHAISKAKDLYYLNRNESVMLFKWKIITLHSMRKVDLHKIFK